jgi:hypothetical protein
MWVEMRQIVVDYRQVPEGWEAAFWFGWPGVGVPEGEGRLRRAGLPAAVAAVMDVAEAHARLAKLPVKVIHGVGGKVDAFLPELVLAGVNVEALDSEVWMVYPDDEPA